VQNGYKAPDTSDPLRSPKVQRFALRSLALGENFLGGRDSGRAGDDTLTPAEFGSILANGGKIRDSAHLQLAQLTMQGLLDPASQRGSQKGAWLLRPFHESLLWYDARRPGPNSPEYSVRKVNMRGSGITLARLLTSPPDPRDAESGKRAVAAIQEALTLSSPLAEISARLESALPVGEVYNRPPDLEQDEQDAWEKGADPRLDGLASMICRHAEGVMRQHGASGPAKLWQLRTILALDLAVHVLQTAWSVTAAPSEERYLLLSLGRGSRALDPVWQLSEDTYKRARIRLSEATVLTLARRMHELSAEITDWASEFEPRSALSNAEDTSVSTQLTRMRHPADSEDYLRLARIAVENANYGRTEEGFRVLLESVGLLAGTRYRYLTAPPELLAALVGALSAGMPMSSRGFFAAVREEWGFVINQESAADTTLPYQLDGAGLERNARRAEQLLTEAGLALSLSDRTTMVGERAAWGAL
jgi:hypothetical protein